MPDPENGLRIERDGGAWNFILDRPQKRNALSPALVEALIGGVAEAHKAGARLLVFRGEGVNFSAGFDFGDIDSVSDADLLLRFVRVETLLQAIAASPCLTLALVHGRTFGAGVDLAAACRWRIAAPGTVFRMPGLKFGIVLGTRRFAALVGNERARGILETARSFDVGEGREIGFVTRVAETDLWPDIAAEASQAADALPEDARAMLYAVTRAQDDDRDLALLTRSAAAPGLRDRIKAYIGNKS